jgi:nickel-type superoxide dismutase maturation protease
MQWPLMRIAVAERSMEPVLCPGDWLLVRRTRRVRPGQIVLARHPRRPAMLIVKRAARREPGGWWLESANPAAGAVDSARFGAVPDALIEGRVLLRYWPLPPARRLRRWPSCSMGLGTAGSLRPGPSWSSADEGPALGTRGGARAGPSSPGD